MIEFANSEFLVLLIPAVLAVAWALWGRLKKGAQLQYSSLKPLKTVSRNLKAKIDWLPTVLFGLAVVFMIIGLARPREANTKVKRNVEGIDIVIALDVSDSMLIEDMRPNNRLEAAKETIAKFI